MAQVIGLRAPEEGQKALDAVMRLLEADAAAAQRFWGYTPEQIGEDVLMKLYPLQTLRTSRGQADPILRNIPPAAATVMHLGREMATPINTGLSLIPAFNALRKMKIARVATPSAERYVPPQTTPPAESPSPGGGLSRRDVLKGLALAPVIAAGAGAGGKALERLFPKAVPRDYPVGQHPDLAITPAEERGIRQRAAEVADKYLPSIPRTKLIGKYERAIEDAVRGGDLVPRGAYSVFQPSRDMSKALDGLERMRKAGRYEGRYARLIDERMKMKELGKKFDVIGGKYQKVRKGLDLREPTGAEMRMLREIDRLGVEMQKQAERVWLEWSKLQQ